MNKNQLFNLLTQLDDRYYEEALGGDPAKPLRIDVSRKPVKWYRIAAPIAACLIIGAGVIAAPRVIDRIRAASSDPIASGSNSTSSSDPTSAAEPKGYYALYPMLDENKVPVIRNTDAATADNTVNMTLSVAEYGEYDVCVTGDGIFRTTEGALSGLYMQKMSISLVKDGELLSSAVIDGGDTSDLWGCYTESYAKTPAVYEFSDCGVAVYERFFGIKDDKITLLNGRSIDSTGVNSLYYIDCDDVFVQTGDSLIDKNRGREYRFSFDTFGDTSGNADNFTELFYDIEDGSAIDVSDYYPMFTLKKLPAFDKEPSADDTANTIKRGMLREITLDTADTDRTDDDTKAALVGEHLYAVNDIIHGDNLAVILYRGDKLLKKVGLAPSYKQTTVDGNSDMLQKYRFDGYTVILINGSCFAAVTDDDGLILLKGLKHDGALGFAITPVKGTQKLVQTGNSLFDVPNGIEYRFSPDNFKYDDPAAEQAHFTVIDSSSENAPQLTNGRVYNRNEDNIPIPDVSGYSRVLGTEEDRFRWKSFIWSAKPAVLTAVSTGDGRQLPNKTIYLILDRIQKTEFWLTKQFPDTPAGGGYGSAAARRAPEIFGFDSNGNMLFSLYIPNEEYVQVTFGGSQESYIFGISREDIYFITNYLDHSY